MKIPDELDELLRHEAKRRGMTISELTREALESHLGLRPQRRVLFGGWVGDSGRDNSNAENLDEIMEKEIWPQVEADAFGREHPSQS